MVGGIQQLIGAIKQGGNPQQMVMSMLEQSTQSNPIAKNIYSLARQGNYAEIEQIARNMTRERGLDFDKEFNSFKKNLGL